MLTRSSSFRLGAVARLIPLAVLAGLAAACADEPTSAPTRRAAGQALRTTSTPGITITPNSLQSDSGVVLTQIEAKEFTVTNTGTTAFVLKAIVKGGQFMDFTMYKSTLPRCIPNTESSDATYLKPGETCGGFLALTPSDTGLRTATWTFETTTGESGVLTMSGRGVRRIGALAAVPSAIDFGEQLAGTVTAGQKVTITNTSNANVNVGTVTSGPYAPIFAPGSGFTYKPCGYSALAPGDSCEVFWAFAPGQAQPYSGWVSVKSDGGAVAVALKGTGIFKLPPKLSVAPTSITFGSLLVGATSDAQKLTLTNVGGDNLALASIALSGANAGDFLLADGGIPCKLSVPLAPNASCELTVAFHPIAGGTRSAALDVKTNGGNVSVTLAGTALQPVLAASPTAISFGNQFVFRTTSTQKNFTLTNVGSAKLTLSHIGFLGPNGQDFALAGSTCSYTASMLPGASCEITLVVTPTGTGLRTGELELVSDGGTVKVAMSVTGVLPPTDVALSIGAAPSLAIVGKPLTYTLTMRNVGPNEAYDVRLADAIPSSTSFASISAPSDVQCTTPTVGGTGTVSCALNGTLASGEVRTVTLVVNVLSGGRTTISNTATLSTASPDSQSANNTATVTTTLYGRK